MSFFAPEKRTEFNTARKVVPKPQSDTGEAATAAFGVAFDRYNTAGMALNSITKEVNDRNTIIRKTLQDTDLFKSHRIQDPTGNSFTYETDYDGLIEKINKNPKAYGFEFPFTTTQEMKDSRNEELEQRFQYSDELNQELSLAGELAVFVSSMAGTALDPAALALTPILTPVKIVQGASVAAYILKNAALQSAVGATEAALIEPIIANWNAKELGQDYSAKESMANIAFSGLFSGTVTTAALGMKQLGLMGVNKSRKPINAAFKAMGVSDKEIADMWALQDILIAESNVNSEKPAKEVLEDINTAEQEAQTGILHQSKESHVDVEEVYVNEMEGIRTELDTVIAEIDAITEMSGKGKELNAQGQETLNNLNRTRKRLEQKIRNIEKKSAAPPKATKPKQSEQIPETIQDIPVREGVEDSAHQIDELEGGAHETSDNVAERTKYNETVNRYNTKSKELEVLINQYDEGLSGVAQRLAQSKPTVADTEALASLVNVLENKIKTAQKELDKIGVDVTKKGENITKRGQTIPERPKYKPTRNITERGDKYILSEEQFQNLLQRRGSQSTTLKEAKAKIDKLVNAVAEAKKKFTSAELTKWRKAKDRGVDSGLSEEKIADINAFFKAEQQRALAVSETATAQNALDVTETTLKQEEKVSGRKADSAPAEKIETKEEVSAAEKQAATDSAESESAKLKEKYPDAADDPEILAILERIDEMVLTAQNKSFIEKSRTEALDAAKLKKARKCAGK